MYGRKISGISKEGDKYGFVDENEVRITAGMTLVLAIISFCLVVFKGEFDITLYLVGTIRIDFLLKVFIGPQFSVFGMIVRLFTKNKEKNWVGSVQKRFAWSIGFFFSTFVMFCLFALGGYFGTTDPNLAPLLSTIALNISNNSLIITPMNPAIIACVLCILFMWFESVVGYCVGCSMYKKLVMKGIMKEYEGQNCINGSCEIKK